MKVRPGDIINEYGTNAGIPHPLLSSYLIIEEGEPLKEACRRTPETFKCLCLINNVETINDKPGDIITLRGDWISSEDEAKTKIWTSFWEVNNEA